MPVVTAKHTNAVLAPIPRQQAERVLTGLQGSSSASGDHASGAPETAEESLDRRPPAPSGRPGCSDQGDGETASAPRWYSAVKHLCENCWALRAGASAAGGSKCQRCGQTHRRGYSQSVLKRGGDAPVGPVPWQQLGQVGGFTMMAEVLTTSLSIVLLS